MIKKLRLRFIILAMLSMLLVLTVIIGGMNIVNYKSVIRDSDIQLDRLAESGGIFELRGMPGGQMPPELPAEMGQMPPSEGEDPGIPMPPEGMNVEDIFAARYFSVLFDDTGNVISTDTESIYTIDTEGAVSSASDVLRSGKERGFKGEFRYLIAKEGPNTRVIFLDCSRSLDNFRSFRNTSMAVSGGGLAVVLLLIFGLSGMIIRTAAESYEKQKRFITDAGHEIKTPLATINADTDVLEAELGEDNEWTADIKQQVRRLTELTNDLVYLSRMEEAGNVFTKERFDLSQMVSETADSFRSRAVAGNKTYDTDISEGIQITGDKASIRRVVSTLLDNAMKYSPDGGKTVIDIPNANELTYVYQINEVNYQYIWSIKVVLIEE